jgi:uncharacterized circularly permuted ATP-grasp superfamily protein
MFGGLRLISVSKPIVIFRHGRLPVVAFDEMCPEGAEVRVPYCEYDGWWRKQDPARLTQKASDAEQVFRKTGITFAVYG